MTSPNTPLDHSSVPFVCEYPDGTSASFDSFELAARSRSGQFRITHGDNVTLWDSEVGDRLYTAERSLFIHHMGPWPEELPQ